MSVTIRDSYDTSPSSDSPGSTNESMCFQSTSVDDDQQDGAQRSCGGWDGAAGRRPSEGAADRDETGPHPPRLGGLAFAGPVHRVGAVTAIARHGALGDLRTTGTSALRRAPLEGSVAAMHRQVGLCCLSS